MAIYHALNDTEHLSDVELIIRSDSQQAIDSLTKWVKIWRQNDGRTLNGQNAMYYDVIDRISRMMEGRIVSITKVKSHVNVI